MPAVLSPSPSVRSPKAIAWTRADCARLAEAGLLPDRYELVAGEIISKMGQNLPHGMAVTAVFLWLVSVFGGRYVVAGVSIDVAPEDNPTSEPEPDFTVLRSPAKDLGRNPEPRDIVMLIEVSDTTLNYDLTVKRDLYARAGIPEYWVVDVNAERIHIFRKPSREGYREATAAEGEQSIATLAQPAATTTVTTLLS